MINEQYKSVWVAKTKKEKKDLDWNINLIFPMSKLVWEQKKTDQFFQT